MAADGTSLRSPHSPSELPVPNDHPASISLRAAGACALLTLLFAICGVVILPAHGQVADSTLNKRFQLAESFMRAGQYDRAVTLLEDLYASRPDAYVFYDRLKQAYENLKQYPDALALVETQLAANRLPVHMAEKARLLYLAGREEDARRAWEEALTIRPGDVASYRMVYQSMYQVRLIDDAIAILERGRDEVGDEAGFHVDLASLYTMNGEYERAVREYVALLQQDANQLGYVRSRLTRLVDEPQAIVAALAVTEQAVRRQPTVRPVRELMAWLYLENGQFMDALNAFRALDRLGEKDGRALFGFAQQAGDAGAFEAASEAYSELLSRYPTALIAPDALFGLASMHEQWARRLGEDRAAAGDNQHFERALETYTQFQSRYPDHMYATEAQYRIAHIRWQVFGDRDAAEQVLDALIRSVPTHPVADEARLDIGLIAVERGELAKGRSIFANIVGTIDRSELVERARYQLALTHFYEGAVETALTVASAVNRNTSMDVANDAIELRVLLQENKGPDSLNTVLRGYGHALYLQRVGRDAEALQAVDSLLHTSGNHSIADDARFLRAALLRATGAYQAAWTAFAEVPLLHPTTPLGDRALFQAAEILSLDLENVDEALKYYTRLLTEYPGSVLAAEARTRIRVLRGDGV